MKWTANIYGLYDKRDAAKRYFYVGSTVLKPEARLRRHFQAIETGRNRNQWFVAKVNWIGTSNVDVEIIEQVPVTRRFEREYFWINSLIEQGVRLTNQKRHGEDWGSWKRDPQGRPEDWRYLAAHLFRLADHPPKGRKRCPEFTSFTPIQHRIIGILCLLKARSLIRGTAVEET